MLRMCDFGILSAYGIFEDSKFCFWLYPCFTLVSWFYHNQAASASTVPAGATGRAPNTVVYNQSHIGSTVEVNMQPKVLKGKLMFVGPHAKVDTKSNLC